MKRPKTFESAHSSLYSLINNWTEQTDLYQNTGSSISLRHRREQISTQSLRFHTSTYFNSSLQITGGVHIKQFFMKTKANIFKAQTNKSKRSKIITGEVQICRRAVSQCRDSSTHNKHLKI